MAGTSMTDQSMRSNSPAAEDCPVSAHSHAIRESGANDHAGEASSQDTTDGTGAQDHCVAADERDLLQRISRRDRQAFEQLYVAYHGRLARFLARFTRNQSDVEEIINDTLLVVWRRSASFRQDSRVSTWIFGIAYRCALKTVRRVAAWERVSALQLHDDGEPVVDDVAGSMADQQLLDFALSHLSGEQRLALLLAYRMGYSCEEIAAIARCPVGTVKARMFHARRRLRTILATLVSPRGVDGTSPAQLTRSDAIDRAPMSRLNDRIPGQSMERCDP
jgi:RNA polymerase sigma-70 factor (ECF subfamily)